MVDSVISNIVGAPKARSQSDTHNSSKPLGTLEAEQTQKGSEPQDITDVRPNKIEKSAPSQSIVSDLESEGAYALAAQVRDVLAGNGLAIANANPESTQQLLA